MTRVLLVTGSRSLARIPGAEAWARGLIREALRGCDLLIVGDAEGPDAWARALATANETRTRCYHVHGLHRGWITDSDIADPVARWDEGVTRGRRYPLARNAAMVADAAGFFDAGATVSVLALVDTASRTQGTLHTVGLARDAGLTVDVRTWGHLPSPRV